MPNTFLTMIYQVLLNNLIQYNQTMNVNLCDLYLFIILP